MTIPSCCVPYAGALAKLRQWLQLINGRYENQQREPSYPTVGFIAQTFNCNIDYLYGASDKTNPDYIIVSSSNDPELYSLIKMSKQDSNVEGRILTYARKLLEK